MQFVSFGNIGAFAVLFNGGFTFQILMDFMISLYVIEFCLPNLVIYRLVESLSILSLNMWIILSTKFRRLLTKDSL